MGTIPIRLRSAHGARRSVRDEQVTDVLRPREQVQAESGANSGAGVAGSSEM